MPLIARLHAAFPLIGGLVILAAPSPALGHAFGQRYDLPVPFGLYLAGAAAAVAVSFVVMALFVGRIAWSRAYPRFNLLAVPMLRWLACPALLGAARAVSVLLLALVVLTGLFGNPTAQQNLAPFLVWIVWWVGIAYVSAFVGNVWAALNPWAAVFAWAEAAGGRLFPGRAPWRHLPYPPALGVWPGFFLLLAFSWLELIFPEPAVPRNVAVMAIAYSAITWAGMGLFGRHVWLRHGEAFAIVFGVFARFAPTEVRVVRPETCPACGLAWRSGDGDCVDGYGCLPVAPPERRELALRPYAMGLLQGGPGSASMTAFVLLMLSIVLFDGALATPQWGAFEAAAAPYFAALGAPLLVVRTAGLIGFWVVFLGLYLVTCWIGARVTGGALTAGKTALAFAFTLVPIAIAYHLAHYLSYIVIQGQYVIPLASDPFGFGWDLFGTADYRVDIAVVGARFAWYAAVSAIIVGHIVAVFLAHVLASELLPARAAVLRSQVPMTALMVIYTVTSLTILAEPITESRSPTAAASTNVGASGAIKVPADAVLPAPGSGAWQPVGEGIGARTHLTYKSMLSAFHDGTRTTVEDILYPYSFAFRWGVREGADDTTYDAFVDRATALVRKRLKGLKVSGIDKTSKSFRVGELTFSREMPITDVYLDSQNAVLDDAGVIAAPWSAVPWHVVALMEEAVARGLAAFSAEEAKGKGVAWLDLVRDEALKEKLAALVAEFESQGFVPDSLKGKVTAEAARERWAALAKFHAERRHFLVTNGPYIMREWSDGAAVLDVFRDFSYPLGIGSFDAYANPRRAYVTAIEPHAEGLRVVADFERAQKAMRTVRLLREPLRTATPQGLGMAIPACRFVAVAADGRIALVGQGRIERDGGYVLPLAGKLGPGTYEVMIELVVSGNAVGAEIARATYTVPGS